MIRRISINFLFNPISTGSLHILGRTRGGGVGAFNGEGAVDLTVLSIFWKTVT